MTSSKTKWLFGLGLLLTVLFSVAATLAVLEVRRRAENPLQPPPITRTIALRDVISPAGADSPVTDPSAPTVADTPEPGVVDGQVTAQPTAEEENPTDGQDGSPAGQMDLLGLPPVKGLATPFQGVDGPQRLEDSRPVSERVGFSRPKWSPLGIDLAVVRTAQRELFILAPNPGASPRFVMRLPQISTPYEWNDDGMTMRVQNKGLQGWVEVLLTGEIYPAQPPTSPLIAVAGRIIALPAFPGEQPILLSPPGDEFGDPVLSPDGAWAAYLGKTSGLHLASLRTGLIWRIGAGQDPVWMPDSSGLLFVRTVSDFSGPVGGDLYLATVDGKHLTNLTRSPGLFELQPSIAPDGERVAFVRNGAIFVGVFRPHLDDGVPVSDEPMAPPPDPEPSPMAEPESESEVNATETPSTGESLLR